MSEESTNVENQKSTAEASTPKSPAKRRRERKKAQQAQPKGQIGGKGKAEKGIEDQKKRLMEGEKNRTKGPKSKEQQLGLNTWASIPYTVGKFEFVTPYSQHIAHRFKKNLAVNAYLAEVYPAAHTWSHWEEITECITALVDRTYEKTMAVFEEVEGQIDHMFQMLCLDENDIPHYVNTEQMTYAVTTPRVRQIMRLMARLDNTVRRMEALWMAEGGVDRGFVHREALRLRTGTKRVIGQLYRQSDRVRRVMAGRSSKAQLLTELKDDLEQHYGAGLAEKDEVGNDMLLEGEAKLTGPLVGDASDKQPEGESASA